MGRPAIFLDRDGTLSHEVGYVNHLSRFRLLPYAVDAVRAINRSGRLAVLVTNQAGVARGYFPEGLIHEVHAHLTAAMESGGARLDGIYTCVHHPTAGTAPYRRDCDCRKPRPGLLRQAESELHADLARSWVIGDRRGDLELAWAAGARAALVKTGYGRGELAWHGAEWRRAPDLVAEHVLEAVERIVALDEGGAERAGGSAG
jgi:D-glycero-D-manno-heptose 1,7-bisphosphate phosphatase